MRLSYVLPFVLMACASSSPRAHEASGTGPMTQDEREFFDGFQRETLGAYCTQSTGYYRACTSLTPDECRTRVTAGFDRCREQKLEGARRLFDQDQNLQAGLLVLDCVNASLDVELAARRVASNDCADQRRKMIQADVVGSYVYDKAESDRRMNAEIAKLPASDQPVARDALGLTDALELVIDLRSDGVGRITSRMPGTEEITWRIEGDAIDVTKHGEVTHCTRGATQLTCVDAKDSGALILVFTRR